MSVRSVVMRAGAAVAVLAAGLTFAATSAHASPQTVSVSLQCDPIPGSQYNSANWHIHLAVDSGQANGSLFGAFADFGAGESNYVQPGNSKDVTIDARDGLGSHLSVSVDGNIVFDQIKTIVCNPPITSATFHCKAPDTPFIVYFMNNPSPSTYNFVVHEGNGLDINKQLTAASGTVQQAVAKNTHYHGTIEQNGTTLTTIDGNATCAVVDETTTTTTVLPTTTTTTMPQPTTTTTVPEKVVGDTTSTTMPATTTTVGSQTADPTTSTTAAPTSAAADPSDPTTVAPAAASTTGQLPFTGSSSLPLGAVGFVLLGAGAIALAVQRRRSDRLGN